LQQPNESPLLSVVIVNYKVPEYTCQAIRSVLQAELADKTEFIVVDNASGDNSEALITNEFPDVQYIGLKNNIGFGKGCNVGVQRARGTYLLFLNPDSLVSKDTLSTCTSFLEEHPDVGIVGPKILKPDGSFQAQCRRMFPTPFDAFSHMFGLSRLFPQSKIFGRYNLTYLDPDVSMEIDAVSGSFMCMRHEVFRKLGGFDDAFFMYGEDLDLCARVKQLGYKVWYHPETQVVHFKGKSSAKEKMRARVEFYRAMAIFSRKYRHTYGAYFPGWLITLGIVFQAILNIGTTILGASVAALFDMFLVNGMIWASLTIRYLFLSLGPLYTRHNLPEMVGMHVFASVVYLGTNAVRGVYSRSRYSFRNALVSGSIASLFFVVGMYLVGITAFSRIAYVVASVLISIGMGAWRHVLPRAKSRLRSATFSTGKVIVIGCGPVASALIKETEQDGTARISGVIWPYSEKREAQFEGYPVLGTLDDIGSIIASHHPQVLLVATEESWYSHIIEALSVSRVSLTVRWVPREVLSLDGEHLPSPIPMKDFSV